MRSLTLRQRLRRAVRGRDGTTAIEFGIIGTMFCMLLLGTIEVGRYYYTYQAVRTIVAEAARQAQIDPSLSGCASGNAINTTVTNRTALDTTALQVCFSRNTTSNVTTVDVNATFNFTFVVPFLGNTARTLTEATQTVY